MKRTRLIILLIEDDENDIFFVKQATEGGASRHTLHAVRHGEEAVRYLCGEGEYSDRRRFPWPNVILTDLKMPRMNGFEFLQWLRKNPQCSVIPAMVYSSSHLEKDVREAYRVGANAYIAKPPALKEMTNLLHLIYDFWSRCECPPVLSDW